MRTPYDTVTVAVGTVTATVGGGITLEQVQGVIGIATGIAGLMLTAATFFWRRREHQHRMKERFARERREESDQSFSD